MPRRAACRFPAPTATACCYLRTLADSDADRRRRVRGHRGWSSSAPAGSASRSPPPPASAAPPSRSSRPPACRCNGCSATGSRASSPTCTASTASTFHFGAQVAAIRGDGSGSAHVALGDGTGLDADAVLVAVGAAPNTELAQRAGLRIDNGVWSTARCAPTTRTSSPPATSPTSPIRCWARVRVEHWANALNSGPAAARAMLDQDVSYDLLPYFFTDQYDLGMEYSGWVPPGDNAEVVVRGDLGPARVHRVLDRRRPGRRRHERQHLGRERAVQALIRGGLAGRTPDPAELDALVLGAGRRAHSRGASRDSASS